jgi:hypothetical protein
VCVGFLSRERSIQAPPPQLTKVDGALPVFAEEIDSQLLVRASDRHRSEPYTVR